MKQALPLPRALLILFLAAVSGLVAEPANLLTNPDFAADPKGNGIPGWTVASPADGTTTFLKTETAGGQTALRFIDKNPKTGLGLQQIAPVTPGKNYRASVRLKGGRLGFYFDFMDGNKKLLGKERAKWCDGGKDGFLPFEQEGVAPEGARFLQIRIYSPTANETDSLVTGVKLVEAPAAVTAVQENPVGGEGKKTAAPAAKTLANPEFKATGKNGIPDGWNPEPEPNGDTTRITVETVDGKTVAHLIDSDSKVGVGLSQILAVEGGKTYRIALSVRGKEVKIYQVFYDGAGKRTGPEKSRGAAGGKHTFETTELVERAPDDARTVKFWIYSTSSGLTDCRVTAAEFGPAPDKAEKALPIPVPTRAWIEGHLLPSHPRLYLTPAEVARIQSDIKNHPIARTSYDKMMVKADGMLKQEPSKYEIPDGLRLLSTSRRVLDRTLVLGLAFHLTGDGKYKERLWKELEAAAAFQDWNNRHYLDTAEMLHAFGLGYDWLYHAWTPAQRKILEEAATSKGLKSSYEAYRGRGANFWWVNGNNNWNFVCNGGTSVAALAFYESNPDLCVDLITNAIASFQHVMEEFEPDGAWYEGPGYWHYSLKYLSPFFRTWETALGTNFGVFQVFPGLAKTADFPVLLTGPSGLSFNFADAGAGKTGSMGELYYLARHMQNPVWHAFEKARVSGSPEELLYFDAGLEGKPLAGVPLDRVFRKVEVAQFRSDWSSNALFLGIKAGANGTPHFHYDLGSFVLEAHGVRFLEDLGMEKATYELYKYAGKYGHDDFYRIRPEGHNTLLLNPGKEAGQGHQAETRLEGFETTAQGAKVSVNLTPAYKDEAKKVLRTFAMVNNRTAVEISDTVEAHEPSTLWWFAHTKAEIVLTPDGRTATLTLPEGDLKAEVVEPKGARFTVMAAAPLPTSPNPDVQNRNVGFRKLALSFSNATSVKTLVRFTPGPKREKRVVTLSLGPDFKPDMKRAVQVEAEAFSSQSGGTVNTVAKIGNSGASFNQWDNPGHGVSWKITLAEDGDYGLLVRYCTAEPVAERKVLVDGKESPEGALAFPGTGGYSGAVDDWKDVFAAGPKGGLRLKLKKGEHTLTLVNVSNPMNMDWIRLVPLLP